jgi:hypothetical protein
LILLGPKLGDPLSNQLPLDPFLERVELESDPAVEVGDLLAQALVRVLRLARKRSLGAPGGRCSGE